MSAGELISIATSASLLGLGFFGYLRHTASLRFANKRLKAGDKLPEVAALLATMKDGTVASSFGKVAEALVSCLGRRGRPEIRGPDEGQPPPVPPIVLPPPAQPAQLERDKGSHRA
jgi:hypothetical protein